jgi:S1-C subfamily serine protease
MNTFHRFFITVCVITVTVFGLYGHPAFAGPSGAEEIPPSLVQIFVQSNPVDLASPWQKKGVEPSSGSGVIIDGQRILTAAHVITDYVSVEVKREGMTKRYLAEVEFVCHECDLALLTVKEQVFFDGVDAMELGQTPQLRDVVSVFGYPIGGSAVSVTEGIVSRVEVSSYVHSKRNLLLAQIDAAINPGNSGGPVVVDGSLVGIAIQAINGAENVGYMVPAAVIDHFMVDVRDGNLDGFPELGASVQTIQNDAMRSSLGMGEELTGALVARVLFDGSLHGFVKPGDVILEIDGYKIAEDLTIASGNGKRVKFSNVAQSKQVGDTMTVAVFREGKRLEGTVELKSTPLLVPRPQYLRNPSYYIFGGVVFQPLTMEYLKLFDTWWGNDAPEELKFYANYSNEAFADQRQVILINKVLAAPLNRGYQDVGDLIVESVNGQKPRDLMHLAGIIENEKSPLIDIRAQSGESIVLDREQALRDSAGILEMHGVHADRSADLEEQKPTSLAVVKGGRR